MAIREEIEKIFLELDNFFRNPDNKQNKRKAYEWVYNKINEFFNNVENKSSFDFKIFPGLFYLFNYSSELFQKDKLDHYDVFPLVFIIEVNKQKGYFTALNFHWVNLKYRSLILKKIIAAFPEKFLEDQILRPINWDKFKKIVGQKLIKYINYAVRNYRFEQLNVFKGLRMLRINNNDMTNAVNFISPKYVGISYADVFKKIKKENFK